MSRLEGSAFPLGWGSYEGGVAPLFSGSLVDPGTQQLRQPGLSNHRQLVPYPCRTPLGIAKKLSRCSRSMLLARRSRSALLVAIRSFRFVLLRGRTPSFLQKLRRAFLLFTMLAGDFLADSHNLICPCRGDHCPIFNPWITLFQQNEKKGKYKTHDQ